MPAGGDSDVAFYWDPRPIPAGAKREFAFAHGVGIASTASAEGNVRLTFGGSFEPNKLFTLSARVDDAGDGQALTLELPPGLARVEGAETQPVTADAEGNARVTFRLPEFQGALRLMAVAIDGENGLSRLHHEIGQGRHQGGCPIDRSCL